MIRQPPKPPLFPYPTLFRSQAEMQVDGCEQARLDGFVRIADHRLERRDDVADHVFGCRSEEHTSELQSRQYLVCRLLLEKKKKKHTMQEFLSYMSNS